MKKPITITHVRLIAAVNAVIIAASFFTGYFINSTENAVTGLTPRATELAGSLFVPVSKNSAAKISQDTTIVYEYFYKADGVTERTQEQPPAPLLEMTRTDLENAFPDWTILSFTPGEVVIRKTLEGTGAKHYTVSAYNGFIAVFYESELKEITGIPLGAFPPEEQARLKAGIQVTGDEALGKLLESYGS